jgi:hypothetical protein
MEKFNKYKFYIEQKLQEYCNRKGYTLVKEWQFHKTRKFRFDFAVLEIACGFEFDGIMSAKSRHTTVTGFTNDCIKTNLAQNCGWKVYRFTVLNYTDIDKLTSD